MQRGGLTAWSICFFSRITSASVVIMGGSMMACRTTSPSCLYDLAALFANHQANVVYKKTPEAPNLVNATIEASDTSENRVI